MFNHYSKEIFCYVIINNVLADVVNWKVDISNISSEDNSLMWCMLVDLAKNVLFHQSSDNKFHLNVLDDKRMKIIFFEMVLLGL